MPASVIVPVERVGAWMRRDLRLFVDCVGFFGACCRAAVNYNAPSFRFSRRTVITQLRFTVTHAVPLISVLAFISGLTIITLSRGLAVKLGIAKTLGDILATILVREVGPLLAAITVIARSATAMSSEMANSHVLGEFDAMDAAGVDPLQVFVVPRVIAMIFGLTILTVLFDGGALLGGLLATWWLTHLRPFEYLASLRLVLKPATFGIVLGKAALCGGCIAFMSCWSGMRTGGTAADLPRSVTRGTVLSLFCVIIFSSLFAVLAIPSSAWLTR